MLTAIVLLWIAIKLQAPLWVFVIIVLILLASVLELILHFIEMVQERRLEKARNEALKRQMGKTAYAEFERRAEARKKGERKE